MKKYFWFFLFCLSFAHAQKKESLVRVQAKASHQTIAPGQTFNIKTDLNIAEPYHIYAQDPGESGMATTFKWKLPKGITVESSEWPPFEKKEFSGIKNNVYQKKLSVLTTFAVSPNIARTKSLPIGCDISWLVCHDTCIPEHTTIMMDIPLAKTSVINPQGPKSSSSKVSPQNKNDLSKLPFFIILLMAFLGGLILNVMPCVLPVISLKVMGLVRDSSDSRSIRKQSFIFSMGILFSFWGLVLLLISLRSLGHHYGWGFQLQSPRFVLGLLLLTFVFSLNLFGICEIGTSLTRLSSFQFVASKNIESFMNGFFATVVATPCTGPFMASALGYALTQTAIISFLIFTALALGFASPYLMIALYPQWIKKMPKPGAWMVQIKQLMAFALMGTSLWLLSILAIQIDPKYIIQILASLILIALVVWIHGQWNKKRTLLLMLICIFSCGWILMQRITQQEDSSFWIPFEKEKIALYRKQGKAVFVDCTASWCVTCQVNKKMVLHRKKVTKLFQKNNVILMKADWTKNNPIITKYLESFGAAGVPLYVFYPADRNKKPQVLPNILRISAIKKLFSS